MSPITGMYRAQLVERYTSILGAQCRVVTQLRQQELWQLQNRWRKTFTPNAEACRDLRGPELWSPLSFGSEASERRHEAVARYASRGDTDFTLIFEHEEVGFVCTSGRLPTYEQICEWMSRGPTSEGRVADVYVVGPDLAWTFVATSEQDGYGGPFFVGEEQRTPLDPSLE